MRSFTKAKVQRIIGNVLDWCGWKQTGWQREEHSALYISLMIQQWQKYPRSRFASQINSPALYGALNNAITAPWHLFLRVVLPVLLLQLVYRLIWVKEILQYACQRHEQTTADPSALNWWNWEQFESGPNCLKWTLNSMTTDYYCILMLWPLCIII